MIVTRHHMVFGDSEFAERIKLVCGGTMLSWTN